MHIFCTDRSDERELVQMLHIQSARTNSLRLEGDYDLTAISRGHTEEGALTK